MTVAHPHTPFQCECPPGEDVVGSIPWGARKAIYFSQAVKDSTRLLLSPTIIGNRLFKCLPINLDPALVTVIPFVTQNRYRTAQDRGHAFMKRYIQHHGHRSGTAPRPNTGLRTGPIGSSCSDLDLVYSRYWL